jgi:hypothetical protein
VDGVTVEKDGKTFNRVPEVIDCGFDSGAMSYAQWHYPYENEDTFQDLFPVDYICEAIDQTRGWFYTMLVISTFLKGTSSYKSCLVNELILDKKGRPSTDPNDFYDGGALLPAAGPKGSGLALIAELVGEALLGPPHEFNWLFVMMKVEAFRELGAYGADAEAFLARVRACPPQKGFERVNLPGELERERAAQRRQDGIVIDETIWDGIAEAAGKVGIDPIPSLDDKGSSHGA